RACVSPPQARTSHIVVTAPSIAQAASTALPPLWNIIAPASAESGLPVIAIQCRACKGGFCVLSAASAAEARQRGKTAATRQERARTVIGGSLGPEARGDRAARDAGKRSVLPEFSRRDGRNRQRSARARSRS